MQPPALSLAPTQAGAPRNDNKNIFLPRAWHSPAESFEKVYFPAGEGAVLTKPGKVAPVADSQGLSGNWMSPSPTPPYTPHTPHILPPRACFRQERRALLLIPSSPRGYQVSVSAPQHRASSPGYRLLQEALPPLSLQVMLAEGTQSSQRTRPQAAAPRVQRPQLLGWWKPKRRLQCPLVLVGKESGPPPGILRQWRQTQPRGPDPMSTA